MNSDNGSDQNQCPTYTAVGYNGYCCTGAYIHQAFANCLHPVLVFVGVIVSLLSYHALDKPTESDYGSSSHHGIRRKYWQPAYYLLKAISLNACVFFITIIPMILYECSFSDTICSQRKGAYGYAVIVMFYAFSIFVNDNVHWVTYGLLVAYGIERCMLFRKSKKFTLTLSVYSHFLALQFGWLKSMLSTKRFGIGYEDSLKEWDLVPASQGQRALLSELVRDCASVFVMAAACFSYVYICYQLLSKPRRRHQAEPLDADTHDDATATRRFSHFSQCERSLTRIYVIIASIFLAHLFFAVPINLMAYRFYSPPRPGFEVQDCDTYETIFEISNILLEIAELAAASMGLIISSQVKAKRLSDFLFKGKRGTDSSNGTAITTCNYSRRGTTNLSSIA